MKRLAVLVATTALIGLSCSSGTTTIETSDASATVVEDAVTESFVDTASDDDANDDGGGIDSDDGAGTDGTEASNDGAGSEPAPSATPTSGPVEADATDGSSSAADSSGQSSSGEDETSDAGDEGDGSDDGTGASTPAPGATPTPSPDAAAAVQAVLDAEDWCGAAQAVEDGTGLLDAVDFTDPVELEAAFRQSAAVIAAAEPLAPPEIAGDVAAVADLFGQFAATLEDAEWNIIAIDTVALENFDGATDQAGFNIERYNFDVCGVGSDPGQAPIPGTPPDTGDFDLGSLPPGLIPDGALPVGLTEEQVLCLTEQFESIDEAAIEQDPTLLFQLLSSCGILP